MLSHDAILLLVILVAALACFSFHRFRVEIVALGFLCLAVLLGIVPSEEAFSGFGHPAVITVVAVLVLSFMLERTGAITLVTAPLNNRSFSPPTLILFLGGIGMLLSGFMNNVGALALLMPLAMKLARQNKFGPSRVLMPLSFMTLLGGTVTLIGTPPNLIVSAYRNEQMGTPYALFDFTVVGLAVAVTGLLYLLLVGWRLVPQRDQNKAETSAESSRYFAELVVSENSSLIEQSIRAIDEKIAARDAQFLGIWRHARWIPASASWEFIRGGDHLVFECTTAELSDIAADLKCEPLSPTPHEDIPVNERPVTMEIMLSPNSPAIDLTVKQLQPRDRFHVSVIAVGRQTGRFYRGIKTIKFAAGDVLVVYGEPDRLQDFMRHVRGLPLQGETPTFVDKRGAAIGIAAFLAAIAAIAFNLVSPSIGLALAVLVTISARVIRAVDAYRAIDWSVVILLGAMIPLGNALVTTGASAYLANAIAHLCEGQSAIIALAAIMIITMTLSDIINNATTAIIMAPLALSVAQTLGFNPDAFLMAVAIGASCAFLTPVGHQNNLLVMTPGGYRFTDYIRVGIWLEILVVLVAVPVLLLYWS